MRTLSSNPMQLVSVGGAAPINAAEDLQPRGKPGIRPSCCLLPRIGQLIPLRNVLAGKIINCDSKLQRYDEKGRENPI